ncbi:hypothetical protein CR513_06396, partial [Mucuna pruriens]
MAERRAEERHLEAIKMGIKIAMMKSEGKRAVVQEVTPIQPFWGQPFSEEIDGTPIPPNFREIVVEPFNGIDLASSFVSQFMANKVKKLEVADLFDIKQNRGESLKSYLACFNNATVRVDDPNQKFFVKAFQKGLRAGSFSGTLALRRSSSMEEIHAWAEKHVEAEEDQTERMEAKRASTHKESKPPGQQSGDFKHQAYTRVREFRQNFTPLTQKRIQIFLLEFPPKVKGRVLVSDRDGWCDFHCAFGHSIEECWTLETQLEKLIQEGYLGRYVQRHTDARRGAQHTEKNDRKGQRSIGWATAHPAEIQRERSRSQQRASMWHQGTIATISGGSTVSCLEGMGGREALEV